MSFNLVIGLIALAMAFSFATACDEHDKVRDVVHPADGDATGTVQEITVAMSDELRFEVAEIQVNTGQRVRLAIDNSDNTDLHDFTVEEIAVADVMSEGGDGVGDEGGHGADTDEYDLHVALEGGRSGILEFTPTESGTYTFRCTEPGHSEGGMTGKLIVSS